MNEEKETGIWRSMSWAISGKTSIGRIVGWKRNGQVQDKAGKDMVGVGLGWGIKKINPGNFWVGEGCCLFISKPGNERIEGCLGLVQQKKKKLSSPPIW